MKLVEYDQPTCDAASTKSHTRSHRAICFSATTGVVSFHTTLSEQLNLKGGMRIIFVNDADKPRDWYFYITDDERGFKLRDRYLNKDGKRTKTTRAVCFHCKAFTEQFQSVLGFKNRATYLVALEPLESDGKRLYRVLTNNNLLDNNIFSKKKIKL